MFQNLIFDWSGTLVDDLPPVLEATNHVLELYGVEGFDREGFRRRFRLPYEEFYREMLPEVPLDELEVHFRKAFSASDASVTILPHAREKLEWCRAQGIRCFVLTSMDRDAFHHQLHALELSEFFEATYAGVLDKRERILGILEAHRLNPAESAFVGDMTHDIDTARHGGMTSIAVLTGYTHAGPLAEARPDLTVPDLGVLRQILARPACKPRPVATVGALILDGAGRCLVVKTHKWGQRWGIPGGKIRRGETSLDALVREIREETGLEIGAPGFVMVQDCIDSSEFVNPAHFLLLNYVACARSVDVVLNEEAQEFRWVTSEQALAMDLNTPTRVLLEEVLRQNLIPTRS
ncbi:MAG: NUDIX domain-containing protein [Verrucomicrobia bacterium]|nr:MAG: NUDIX domain-containing protein [Verrucomicrobiota bacterium]TAE85248.1 MAG: NUDIX domain-containing protein [Verrucomicrobiota bacterium]TAF23023.1 MAG: NUDIX domain-containing protein [Verrucomicrobiota bacterium]